MITYYEGTIFNIETEAIVNTVNCTGVMGAGIALEFMLRYPQMLEDYEMKCESKRIATGQVDYFVDREKIIINFPTKWHFKYPSKLIWIEQGLQNFIKTYTEFGIKSVAFPKLGTGKGGLSWSEVKLVMEKYLSDLDIDVYICLDSKREAEGIEKTMLDKFNLMSMESLSSIVKLSAKQKDNLLKRKPFDRFWKIAETESVGIKTYSSIFKYFYDYAKGYSDKPNQISMFDG
jgi:O-acetyl-ADP-ribose deacetylase (regulator of RNase III)